MKTYVHLGILTFWALFAAWSGYMVPLIFWGFWCLIWVQGEKKGIIALLLVLLAGQ